jgi:anaerobic selenocysteine-containing dehydrogenase
MSANILGRGLTRRQFVKTTAAVTAAVALGEKLLGGHRSTLVASAAGALADDVWLGGRCQLCKLSDCVNRVHVVNGVVVYVEGHPESPTNKGGMLCPRGMSAAMNLYNPYRVKAPLKRTNTEKGLTVDPKWVEIGWDEAFTTVAAKLKESKDYDPRSLMLNSGFGVGESALRSQFLAAFGSPNSISSNGPLCAVHFATGLVQANTPISACDQGYCNYQIAVGRSVGSNHGVANGGALHQVDSVRQRGMKFVTVDPRAGAEAALGEWVPIRPGTDLAFALAMAQVMMYEVRVFDLDFMKNRTNAPYLIGADGDYVRDATTKKPLLWDLGDGKAKTFDDKTIKDAALEGTFTVGAASVQPGYQKIKDRIKEYTPEWAEQISTVPAATTRRLAKEFTAAAQIGSTIVIDDFTFPFRPASIIAERGAIAHKNGTQLDLVTKWINMMVGNLEVPGGVIGIVARGNRLAPDADGVVTTSGEAVGVAWKFPPDTVDMATFYPNRHTTVHLAYKAIENPKAYLLPYDVRVLWVFGGNSIRGTANPAQIERAVKKIPFVWQISYNFDSMAELSDVLLPEHAMLERLVVTGISTDNQTDAEVQSRRGELGRNPVPPVFNSKFGDEILIELADRIGILKGKNGIIDRFGSTFVDPYKPDIEKRPTLAELLENQVRSLEAGKFGLKDLQAKGFLIRWESQKLGYNYYYVPGNQTRHPFYFQRMKMLRETLQANMAKAGVTIPNRDMTTWAEHYDTIPHWIPPADWNAPAEYDLFAMNYKVPLMMFGIGGMEENPWFDELIDQTNPYLRSININRATAAKKGLKDGDDVWVQSQYGKTRGKVNTSELFHPDVVGIAGCYGTGTMHMNPIAKKGPHFNSLLSGDEPSMDPISGGLDIGPKVKVYKV